MGIPSAWGFVPNAVSEQAFAVHWTNRWVFILGHIKCWLSLSILLIFTRGRLPASPIHRITELSRGGGWGCGEQT